MGGDSDLMVKGFSTSKRGEIKNEDCWGWSRRTSRLAIADGSGNYSYSDRWANILVRRFVWSLLDFPRDRDSFVREFRSMQRQWPEAVPWEYLMKKRPNFIRKAQQGAFSTLLGVILDGNRWEAFAIGDCNLFILDGSRELKRSWPQQSADEFSDYPDLIPSLRGDPEGLYGKIRRTEGELDSGDTLVVCSDVLSEHLLRLGGVNGLWDELLSDAIKNSREYALWIERLRDDRDGLRSDDCTTVILQP